MADIEKIKVKGTDYTVVDSTVPSWARGSTKPTYNGSEVKYTGTTGSTVTTNTTLNVAVQALDTAVNNRLKYVLLSQAEYDSLVTKDSGTLYLIREVKYTITLTGNSSPYDILVNGESKTTSDFPMEVDEDSSLSFKCYSGHITSSVVMGGTDITSSVRTTQSGSIYLYDITNITGDIVITINNSGSGGAD